MGKVLLVVCLSLVVAAVTGANVGGYQPASLDDPGARQAVDFAVTQVSGGTGNNLRVVRVDQQVVNGMNYRITLQGTDNNRQCVVVIYATRDNQYSLTSSNCGRSRRESPPRLGGYSEVDTDDSGVQEAAGVAFDQLSTGDSSLVRFRVVKAYQQVVAGMNYKLTLELENQQGGRDTCEVVVWRQLSGEHKVTESNCDSSIHKRQLGTPGGFSDVDPNDERVLEAARFATDQLSTGDSAPLDFVRVIKVESQVVAGTNYRMKIEVRNQGQTSLCNVEVWRKLNGEYEMTRGSCEEGLVVGGWTDYDTDDSTVQEVAQFAVSKMSVSYEGENRLGLISVLKAQSEPVAGKNYHITLKMAPTNCAKNENRYNCTPNEDDAKVCRVVVWDRPWMNKRELISSTCE